MDKRIKARWVKALRSGKYKQGKEQLRQTQPDGTMKYCCLGVLCDLYAKSTREKWTADDHIAGSRLVLPLKVMIWAKLDDSNPDLGSYQASEWNDYKGKRFSGIATLIEKYL